MSERAKRYHLLDEIRGFAILCMVFFHGFYLMGEVFSWGIGSTLLNFFMPAEPVFACLFIIMSGISSRLSKNNALRGAKLLMIATLVTFVTYGMQLAGVSGVVIWFGILHLLSVAMLFYAATEKVINKIHPIIVVAICAALFIVTYNLELGYIGVGRWTYELPTAIAFNRYIYPFGVTAPGFFSADYFPVFPWIFVFIAGTAVGKPFGEGRVPKLFSGRHVPFFAFCGRHSLIIYLAHQPILYGAFFLINKII